MVKVIPIKRNPFPDFVFLVILVFPSQKYCHCIFNRLVYKSNSVNEPFPE